MSSVKVTDFIASAKRTLQVERDALSEIEARLDGAFERAVETMAVCSGKVVVTGMGKSGLIGQKIAATLASTGSPAFFLHPGEASHGDLGMVGKDDVLMLMSNSGETEELVRLLPALKRLKTPLIALTGNPESTLARHADVLIDVSVSREACPLGLAPTASTTALLALGDALAVALLEHRGFSAEDFAAVHPGGTLGKRLLTRVADVMHGAADLPLTGSASVMREALYVITSKRFGTCGVVDDAGRLLGVITDGDVRRSLERDGNILDLQVTKVMTESPKTIAAEALAAEALNLMERHGITCLFVCQPSGIPQGILHLHDLLKSGVV